MPDWGRAHRAVGRRVHPSSSASVSMNPEDDKENIPPWRSRLSCRLKRTPKRSLLPSWYPRTPLRDITAIVQAIQKRRARQRELERIRMEQSTDSPAPLDVSTAETTDSPNPEDVPVMPDTRDPTLRSIATPQSGASAVTNFLDALEVTVPKENSASLVASSTGTPLGPTTPDVIAHTVANIDSCTPASSVPSRNSVSLIASCDQTPVSEVIGENWWLKPRADTSNAGGAGAETKKKTKKKSVLQQRSRVSLMR